MQERIDAWLDELASAAPTPGGGGAAALSLSAGASLISMVCNLTIGKPKYAQYEALLSAALAKAEAARRTALQLVAEDARAFAAVMAAYKLPKATDTDKAARLGAIQQALADAAAVPLQVAEIAAEVIQLAQDILPGANKNVISDVAVAAALARGALQSSVVNVEINLGGLTEGSRREALAEELRRHRAALDRADAVVALVRERIAP